MNPKWLALPGVLILAIGIFTQQQHSSIEVERDQPGEEEHLNRELWEFAKKSPYDQLLRYVKQAQAAEVTKRATEVTLPNGWKIAPAGTQVEVGRLPYEVIPYAGQLVVLNTGWYDPAWFSKEKEDQEVSVVDPKQDKVVKTLKFKSLFPSAQVGQDGDLYISGGFDQKVYRVNQNFATVREYQMKGYTAGLAAVDVKRGVVVGDRYDQLSVLRTIEVALGLDPINLNDALAVPMFGIFNEKPNNSAYVLPQPSTYLMQADKELYKLK